MLVAIFLIFFYNFFMVVFAQKPLDQESQKIGKGVEFSVEANVAVRQLDAIANIGVFILLQQLRGQFEVEPRYYADKNSEIDFVLQSGMEIIPIEAKGGEARATPSFKKYIADHKPEHAFRFSKRGYRKDGDFTNLPLYLARKTKKLL